ncbi:MAG: RHS repeat-associated core domain-containing protein [Bacilli bacterium]|nr:RHS repeat-associated core domain-containing protein [Bacilli bacterium]
MGNIINIIDSNGNIKVEYKYNAWGKVLSVTGDNTIKNVNSYLYKGYYYDEEAHLYYCNSRYYDPDICRWISIDEISYLDRDDINGINLWCYCGNNPVVGYDPNGQWNRKKFLVTTVVCAVVATAIIAATIATAGGLTAAITPVILTTAIKASATVTIAATIATAVAVPISAGMEQVVALDLSLVGQTKLGISEKMGLTLLMDFENGRSEIYGHTGTAISFSRTQSIGPSYSLGIVKGYEKPGDYEGPFYSKGIYAKGFGLDYSYDPRRDKDETVRATSLTFGQGTGVYAGKDDYTYWGGWNW